MSPEAENDTKDEFASAIAQVEAELAALKQRYAQVERDRQQRDALQARQQALQTATTPDNSENSELEAIAEQIEALDFQLESRLPLRWRALLEPFWQAVRFGGLGVLLGWSLGFWVSRLTPESNPTPERSPTGMQREQRLGRPDFARSPGPGIAEMLPKHSGGSLAQPLGQVTFAAGQRERQAG